MWGSVLQLLVDDECIAARLDVVRVAHPCKKQSKPVLVPEHAWEGDRVYVYGSVLYDPSESLFRMWYMSRMEGMAVGDRDPRLNRQPLDFVLYATYRTVDIGSDRVWVSTPSKVVGTTILSSIYIVPAWRFAMKPVDSKNPM